MFKFRLVVQDSLPGRISEIYRAIVDLADVDKFHSLRVAVAYASRAGCKDLAEGLHDRLRGRWKTLTKEWMVSLDFGRTDPNALEFLKGLPRSSVRIPNAVQVLRSKLVPRDCFHPKIYMFGPRDVWVNGPIALLSGSGNLTLSGLHTGTEQGISLVWKPTLTPTEHENELRKVRNALLWWQDNWKRSVPVTDGMLAIYRKIRPRLPHVPHEESSLLVKDYAEAGEAEIRPAKGLHWAQARCLWVQTYELYKNLGKARPGNQLDLRRGTRVYFGFSPKPVSRNTVLGQVILQYQHMPPRKCSVRFGNNWMDKVNLPLPGEDGPDTYDNSCVHFERIKPGHFCIKLASGPKEVQTWREKSKKSGLLDTMAGGRQFGLYS